MKRQALIIHGWRDDPSSGWLGWIGEKLKNSGYVVHAPRLDADARPLLTEWQKELAQASKGLIAADKSLIIGHSLGCFLALRLLESWGDDRPVDGLVLVSGFFDPPRPEAERFFAPEPNWPAIQSRALKRLCIYSDDDDIVTPDRTRRLAHRLEAELMCVANRGHFLGSRGMDTFPELSDWLEAEGFTTH